MQTLTVPNAAKFSFARPVKTALGHSANTSPEIEEEAQAAKDAFAQFGGGIDADDLAAMICATGANGVGIVAKLVLRRGVVSVRIAGTYWLPIFQFNRSTWSPRPALTSVLRELTPVMGDLEIAQWFSSPNQWLEGGCPADSLIANCSEIVQAARVQRFVCSI